jgi:hypothetical protein
LLHYAPHASGMLKEGMFGSWAYYVDNVYRTPL